MSMLDKDIKMLKDINSGAKLIGDFLKDNKINITVSSFFKYLTVFSKKSPAS